MEALQFPFHALAFVPRLIMADSRFVTSDSAKQKDVSFFIIPAQKAVTDVETFTPILFREFSLCSSFMEVKSVVGDFIRRTVANLQPLLSPHR
jgi:hypothetical protein